MARFAWTLALAATLVTASAHAQLTRDAVGNGRSALEAQLTVGEYVQRPSYDVCSALHPCTPLTNRDVPFVTLQFRLAQHITRLSPDLSLEFDLDAALVAEKFYTSRGEWQGFWAGSPWLGLSLASRAAAQTLRVSFGIAAPLAGTHAFVLDSVTPGGTGGWNEWLTLRSAVPFGFQGLGAWRFDHLDVGIDAALVLAPVVAESSLGGGIITTRPGGVSGWAAAGAWLTGRLSEEVDLGARLQGVVRLIHTDATAYEAASDSTSGRAALTPFIRYWFSRAPSPSPVPAYLELKATFGFLVPDGPVFFADRYTASFALATGTTW